MLVDCDTPCSPNWGRRWLPVAAWLSLVVTLIACADEGVIPRLYLWVDSIPLADKVGHFILIGTLAWLFNRALRRRTVPVGAWHWQLGGLIIGILMTLEEFSQLWIPLRHFSLGDLTANYAGIAVAALLTANRPAPPASAPPAP